MKSRSTFLPQWRSLAVVAIAAIAAVAALAASGALAQTAATTCPLLKNYIGSPPDTDALLKEPGVRAQIEALVGKQLPEPTGGALALQGNAPHKGTEEEAIVCIADQGQAPHVEAAIIAKMREADPMAAMNAAIDLFKKCAGRGR